MKLPKNIQSFFLVRVLLSLQLNIVCLFFLFLQTLWGTFYQIDYGLYQTQHKIFYSWFTLFGGFIPFPGAKLILWVLFINLVCVSFFRFKYNKYKIGILIIHIGLLVLIAGCGITYYLAEETQLSLREGQSSNVSEDYHTWELALWTATINKDTVIKKIEAFTVSNNLTDSILFYSKTNLRIRINIYYSNSRAFVNQGKEIFSNGSNIGQLKPEPINPQSENNIAGLIGEVFNDSRREAIILFGGERNNTVIAFDGKVYYLKLRKIKHHLPLQITLNNFVKRDYVGTTIPRSYESFITQSSELVTRNSVISMNNPLRYKDYTFFQTSFTNDNGTEISTFSIVKNPARVVPYISCLLVGFGLILHFFIILIRYTIRKSKHA